jgi:transposase
LRSSADREKHGHITKEGSKSLRWALIQAVPHVVRNNDFFRRFYLRISGRRGVNIAKVAVARKLLSWIYHMLKEGKEFDEIGSGELVN